MDVTIFLIILAIILLIGAYLLGRSHGKTQIQPLPTDFISIYNDIKELPSKILAVIQGSINPQKGKVAELLTYAELRYDYDRIIPLGHPIDFIGIKNGKKVDFIEVKSGGSQLSFEEKAIQELIKEGKVNFRLIRITNEEVDMMNTKEEETP